MKILSARGTWVEWTGIMYKMLCTVKYSMIKFLKCLWEEISKLFHYIKKKKWKKNFQWNKKYYKYVHQAVIKDGPEYNYGIDYQSSSCEKKEILIWLGLVSL